MQASQRGDPRPAEAEVQTWTNSANRRRHLQLPRHRITSFPPRRCCILLTSIVTDSSDNALMLYRLAPAAPAPEHLRHGQ